jgi:ABC-type transport system involved in multi-copper enzyme maturation permease subunit
MSPATTQRAEPAASHRLFAALVWRSATEAQYVVLACVLLLAGLQVLTVGQASALEAQHSFSRMADLVPGFLQRGLGAKSLLLASFKGSVAFGYFHPVVVILVAVLAVYITTEPAHEVESGLVDLTLARSVPRHILITRSLVLGVGSVLTAVILMFTGTRLGLQLFALPQFDAPTAASSAALLAHLAAVALCFGGMGLAIAAGARRWSTAFTTAALAVVALYLLDFLAIVWPALRWLAWLSPFHYFPALSILTGEVSPWGNLAVLLLAAAVFSAYGYWRFSERDL